MTHSDWSLLQLFGGEGGAGGAAGASGGEGSGEGSATGVESVDPGHQRLLELGVPEEKLKRRAKRAAAKLPEGAVRTAPSAEQPAPKQVATAEEAIPTEEKQEVPSKPSWDELMKDPDYNRHMQETVQSRLRTAKAAEENLGKLAPAVELLARKYGMDVKNMDYEALAKAVSDDDAYYEEMALEKGVSLETVKRIDQQERQDAREKQMQQETLEQQKIQRHIESLEQQANALKSTFPDIDLRKELQNPAFVRMTSPNVGISVEDAYYAVHRKEIMAAGMQVTAQRTAEQISNAIQSGSRRPDENRTSGQSPSVTTFDYSKASKAQREALKQQIYAAKARGEKLYPGR